VCPSGRARRPFRQQFFATYRPPITTEQRRFSRTFISAGLGGLSAPHRAAVGPDGNFYVASANNDRILRYHGLTGAFLGVFATAAQLDYPVDLQWGPDGNLYVSSQLNDSIVRFNGATGAFIDVFVAPCQWRTRWTLRHSISQWRPLRRGTIQHRDPEPCLSL
jgi:streptogramin lyase